MNTNKNKTDRHSKTRRAGVAIVAAIALALALIPAATIAGEKKNFAPGQAKKIVNDLAKLECVPGSVLAETDLLLIEMHAWDERSRLHSLTVCPAN